MKAALLTLFAYMNTEKAPETIQLLPKKTVIKKHMYKGSEITFEEWCQKIRDKKSALLGNDITSELSNEPYTDWSHLKIVYEEEKTTSICWCFCIPVSRTTE